MATPDGSTNGCIRLRRDPEAEVIPARTGARQRAEGVTRIAAAAIGLGKASLEDQTDGPTFRTGLHLNEVITWAIQRIESTLPRD